LFLICLPLLGIHILWVIRKEGPALDNALKILIVAVLVYALSLF